MAKKRVRLTDYQERLLMYYYLCTKKKIVELAEQFNIDRSTVHKIINRHYHAVRKPLSGNWR